MSATPEIPDRFRDLAGWVASVTAATPGALAAHAGGSLSTGRLDAWSDLDVSVHTSAGAADEVFEALLRRLGEEWEVTGLWNLPTPTWHGGRQLFAEVARGGAAPVVLDLVAMDVPDGGVVVDPRRHGLPVPLHDPSHVVRVTEEDDDALASAALASARRIADRLFVARWIVEKSVAREQWPEAHAYYSRFGVDATVQLLRTIHCPSRWDYGVRYLDTDLPEPERLRVEALLPGSRSLGELTAECFAWQEELLREVLAHPDDGRHPARTQVGARELVLDLVARVWNRGEAATWADTSYEVLDCVVEDERVALRWRASARLIGRWGPVDGHGQLVSWTGSHVFTVRQGRITAMSSLADVFGKAMQLGVVMSPPADGV